MDGFEDATGKDHQACRKSLERHCCVLREELPKTKNEDLCPSLEELTISLIPI